MTVFMEIAKVNAIINNLIAAIQSGASVDVLGSLYVIQDQMERVDEAADNLDNL